MKHVLQSFRSEEGGIYNSIDYVELIKQQQLNGSEIDVCFCFFIKTLVDDFGEGLIKISDGRVNKEQFEAQFISNLTSMLSMKTRVEKKE